MFILLHTVFYNALCLIFVPQCQLNQLRFVGLHPSAVGSMSIYTKNTTKHVVGCWGKRVLLAQFVISFVSFLDMKEKEKSVNSLSSSFINHFLFQVLS